MNKKVILIIFGILVLIFLGYLFKINILDIYPKAIKESQERKKIVNLEKETFSKKTEKKEVAEKIEKFEKKVEDKNIILKNKILSESHLKIPSGNKECNNFVNLKERTTLISENQYSLLFPTNLLKKSSMKYCADKIKTHGSAFEINYVDFGGKGMDGYVNGVIAGVQKSGKWKSGDFKLTGMPVLLKNLDKSMIIQWKVSQENSLDETDKWMASINMIFDNEKIGKKPENSERDYDLVIELNSKNFNNSTEDLTEGNKRNYFARNKNGSLKTFDISVDGKIYKYAVRYKFYYNSGDQNNKVHVKYIPINEKNVPPYLNHSAKAFIDNSKDFIQYANMPEAERKLANEKVALKNLYLKSIRAGYEVYKGESVLRNDFFKIVFE